MEEIVYFVIVVLAIIIATLIFHFAIGLTWLIAFFASVALVILGVVWATVVD